MADVTQAWSGGMSKATHTPGPWAIRYPSIYAVDLGERVGRVAAVSIAYKDTVTFEANARLIAAAPDLLEALEDLCSFDSELTQEKWDKARAAIAKARGQS